MAKATRGRFGRFKAAARKRVRRRARKAAPIVANLFARVAQTAARNQPFFVRFFAGRRARQASASLFKKLGLA